MLILMFKIEVDSFAKEKEMKHKGFLLSTIAVIAIVGLLVFEHATSAQRPDRNAQPEEGQRGQRPGGERGNRDMMRMFNPNEMVNNSWLDLTFSLKVDDETLVKARPVYQATRDKFEKKLKEIRESGDIRGAFQEMRTFTTDTANEFQKNLKEVLSEEQMKKLNELTKQRMIADQERRNRFRGGEGGQRGGGQGGQGGQRGTR